MNGLGDYGQLMTGGREARADDRDRIRRAELVLALRARGVSDRSLLAAMEFVSRLAFVDPRHDEAAYADVPLPIACGQTQAPPSMIARLLNALDLTPDHKLLDVGTGSGYAAAVAARLVRSVTSIDRFRGLVEAARQRFEAIGADTITCVQADGLDGYPAGAPYDRILVTGSVATVPGRLVQQLKLGGVMVVAIGPAEGQMLVRLTRADGGERIEELGKVRFVPLVAGLAAAL